MTFDENVLYKDKETNGSGTTKQVGDEVELRKNSLSDVVADTTQGTSEIVADELEVEQVTPEHVLKSSSIAIRVPDRYVSSLHCLLLIDEGESKLFDEVLQFEDTTKWKKIMDDRMFRLQ